jgi:hypothetical protein
LPNILELATVLPDDRAAAIMCDLIEQFPAEMAPHAGAVLASLTFAWPSAIDDTSAAHQLL